MRGIFLILLCFLFSVMIPQLFGFVDHFEHLKTAIGTQEKKRNVPMYTQ